MWQKVIPAALEEFDIFLNCDGWMGRENEVVNLFAHEFLPRAAAEHDVLLAPSQVGIEVSVPQVTGSGKRFVRKDLVIWPKPLMTAWTPVAVPAVIMEWKWDDWNKTRPDIEWLKLFTAKYPSVIGYAVCAFTTKGRGVHYVTVANGQVIVERPE